MNVKIVSIADRYVMASSLEAGSSLCIFMGAVKWIINIIINADPRGKWRNWNWHWHRHWSSEVGGGGFYVLAAWRGRNKSH